VEEQSQWEFRNGVAAGIFHRLQCSAGPMGIRIKLLILLVKLVVTQKGLLGFAAPEDRGPENGPCAANTG
jgi:hypothetical protein